METVKQLNKQEFTTKVADIEKSKGEWKFLGERPAVIDFFATWCGPCCLEIPFVEKKVEKYKDNPNIEFVSISLDRDKKEWLDKLEKDNSSWQQYIIPDNFESEFAKEYNITFIPRFMLFDKEGKIISIDAPRPSDDEAFEALIAPYVK